MFKSKLWFSLSFLKRLKFWWHGHIFPHTTIIGAKIFSPNFPRQQPTTATNKNQPSNNKQTKAAISASSGNLNNFRRYLDCPDVHTSTESYPHLIQTLPECIYTLTNFRLIWDVLGYVGFKNSPTSPAQTTSHP